MQSVLAGGRAARVGLAIALSTLTVVAVVGHVATNEVLATTAWVERSHRVIAELDAVHVAMLDTVSARRAFALTGDEAVLAGRDHDLARISSALAALRELTRGRPEHRRQVDELATWIDERLRLLTSAIEVRRTRGPDAAREATATAVGVASSARGAALLVRMKADQQGVLAERQHETARSLAVSRGVQLAGIVASFLILLAVFHRLRREVAGRIRSETAAQTSEQHLALTLRSIGDGVITTDVEGRIARMNPVAEQLTGWSEEEARTRASSEVFRIVDETTREPAPDPLARALREGVVVGLVHHTVLIAKDGRECSIADSAAPIRDAGGELRGAVLVFTDVSAGRAAQRQLAEAEAFLDSIVENIPSMITVKDAVELRYRRVNRAAEQLLGRPRAEVVGKTIRELASSDQVADFEARDRAAIDGEASDVEERISTPGGEHWIHTRRIPIRDLAGRPTHLISVAEDVSERGAMTARLQSAHDELEQRVTERTAALTETNAALRTEIAQRAQVEAALAASQLSLREVEQRALQTELARQQDAFDRFFTLSLDMLCIAGVDGYFRRVNPGFDVLGYDRAELTSRPFLDFVHPDDIAATLLEVERLAQGIPTIRFQNRYRCRDGSYRWLAWVVAPDGSGTLYAVARDVTESRLAEDALRRASQAAELANAELEAFSYSVAHDLRAPLRGINGFAQALLEDYRGKFDADADEYLGRIAAGSQRMGQLIDALLGLSRVSRTEPRRELVDLSALATATVEQLRAENPARDVVFSCPAELVVEGDLALLRALLANLIGNAWKFTRERAPARIELAVDRSAEQPVFRVRDDGAGFDMAYASKLFAPFQRLHAASEFEGTGIGLATVQRIVHRHGGRIWAESVRGAGATFYFTLSDPRGAAHAS